MERSSNYVLLRAAILAKQQVSFVYKGLEREACPHAIGLGKRDEEKVLVYQHGGKSSSGGPVVQLPETQRWRCLDVSDISELAAYAGDWHTGSNHGQPANCIKELDVEVEH